MEIGKIKLFGTFGGALIIGEVIIETRKMAKLRHPGSLMIVGREQRIVQTIPQILVEWKYISENFKLDKQNVLYSGEPSQALCVSYGQYREKLYEMISGIKIAKPGDVPRAPRDQDLLKKIITAKG